MTRVKRGKIKNKNRKNILKKTKGYRWGRSTKKKQAMEAIAHAGVHAYNHRKQRKTVNRGMWHIKIGGALKEHGLSYSKFIGALKKKNINVDRKILADLVVNNPEAFNRVVEEVKS